MKATFLRKKLLELISRNFFFGEREFYAFPHHNGTMHLPENQWAQLIWECLNRNDGQPKQRPKWTKLLHSH